MLFENIDILKKQIQKNTYIKNTYTKTYKNCEKDAPSTLYNKN